MFFHKHTDQEHINNKSPPTHVCPRLINDNMWCFWQRNRRPIHLSGCVGKFPELMVPCVDIWLHAAGQVSQQSFTIKSVLEMHSCQTGVSATINQSVVFQQGLYERRRTHNYSKWFSKATFSPLGSREEMDDPGSDPREQTDYWLLVCWLPFFKMSFFMVKDTRSITRNTRRLSYSVTIATASHSSEAAAKWQCV